MPLEKFHIDYDVNATYNTSMGIVKNLKGRCPYIYTDISLDQTLYWVKPKGPKVNKPKISRTSRV